MKLTHFIHKEIQHALQNAKDYKNRNKDNKTFKSTVSKIYRTAYSQIQSKGALKQQHKG